MNHITQEPDDSDMNQVHQGNAQVQYPTMHFGTQPKPASVEEIKLERWGRADNLCLRLLDRMDDGYWTPWHIATEAITQQAEQLAQALAEVEQLKLDRFEALKERDQLRTQLAALQYDGELPEPAVPASLLIPERSIMSDALYTADQVRQAISKALANQAQGNVNELAEALKATLYSLQVPCVSCQKGVISVCKCRKCVIDRGDAALANAKSANVKGAQ